MKRFLYILLPILLVSGQTKSKTFLSDHLTGLKPFIGNTYKGNFINSTIENPMIDVLSFERALNGNAVKVIMNGDAELKKITFDENIFKESKPQIW